MPVGGPLSFGLSYGWLVERKRYEVKIEESVSRARPLELQSACESHYSEYAWILVPSLNTLVRFEKSLYDLIRGLRNHKGNEREYIQHSLRECRTEIKGFDMGALAATLHLLAVLASYTFQT